MTVPRVFPCNNEETHSTVALLRSVCDVTFPSVTFSVRSICASCLQRGGEAEFTLRNLILSFVVRLTEGF